MLGFSVTPAKLLSPLRLAPALPEAVVTGLVCHCLNKVSVGQIQPGHSIAVIFS